MRIAIGVLALLGTTVPCVALADPAPRFETTGFFGAEYFPSDTGLGNSKQPEQRPQTSALFGARVSYFALPALAHGDRVRLDLGIEAELALATSWTGYGFADRRMSYFAPVFGWRGEVILRLSGLRGGIRPHLAIGGGGATVVSDSPYMAKETDPEFLWGLGASLLVAGNWQLRADVRQGVMPAAGSGASSTFEAGIGIGTSFGLPRKPPRLDTEVAHEHDVPRPADKDSDGDGIPDRLDACPAAPETVNGVEDQDGCPEADPDGDGLVGAADKCPKAPEDFDHFQDDDGCPDPDNDGDGIPDALDACPNDPETFNGFDDDDGCPDKVPAGIEDALASASAVRFEPNRTRLTPATKTALDRTLKVLRDRSGLKVQLVVHADGPADKARDLAKKRGDAVKGYLVEQGVADDQIILLVGDPVAAKAPTIEIKLWVPSRAKP